MDNDDSVAWGWVIGIAIIVLFAWWMNDSPSNNSYDGYSSNSSSYSDYSDSESDDYFEKDALEFNGYECTDDCSGHEAGYEWAAEHDIDQYDVDNYSGNSQSFQEGMQSYVDGY